MDIHAPHEPVHTWKDFFTHLAIVTIGLFIALMLEALVEHVHHRHIVREARENIRRELEDNHKAAIKDDESLRHNMEQIEANIHTIHMLRDKTSEHGSLTSAMEYDSFDHAAWLTARDTGAFNFMPYDEAQQYTDLYDGSDLINKRAQAVAEDEFHALAPTLMGDDLQKLSPALYEEMLKNNAGVLINLCTLRQYIQQLDLGYVKQLDIHGPITKMENCANLMQPGK